MDLCKSSNLTLVLAVLVIADALLAEILCEWLVMLLQTAFCILVIFLVTVLAIVVVAIIPNFGFIDVLVWC